MEQHTCSNCSHVFTDKYCNHCGQKRYTEKDKTLKHFFEEAVHFFTHFDGSFFTTLKTVLLKPGKLSEDYCMGRRKPYYKPISFFLLMIVLYLLFPTFTGLNMRMGDYKGTILTGKIIESQIQHKLKDSGISEETLAEKFHKLSVKTSKVLLLLMIPLTMLFIFPLYFYKKKLLFDYLILSTEINIFFILFFFFLFPILLVPIILVAHIRNISDDYLMPLMLVLFAAYYVVLLQRFFKEKLIWSILKGPVLTLAYMFGAMQVYRFIIFEVTFALL